MPKRWKGCCMMCAAWIRGDGVARVPISSMRKLGGKRNVKRGVIQDGH